MSSKNKNDNNDRPSEKVDSGPPNSDGTIGSLGSEISRQDDTTKEEEQAASGTQETSGSKQEDVKPEPWVSEETITGLFSRISDVTSSAFKFAKKTTDTSYKVGKALIQSQDQLKVMLAAGQSLKDLREVAGLTANELADAMQLKDKSIIEAVENGTATLSFELILRLSALLARNDPIPFILKYSRTYSPDTWKLLNDWGAGRLPLQYQREREFINIFRSKDEARQLSDAGYNQVLEFTRHAFNMALHFVAEQESKVQAFKDETDQTLKKERNTRSTDSNNKNS